MNVKKLVTTITCGALLAACSSGDINVAPSTNVSDSNNTVNNGGGNANAVCASYQKSGQTISGTADADGNCTYDSSFVGPKNNLTVDLLLPKLADGGAHIFTSSLFVGETHRSNADLQAAGIAQGGDGPTLTIQAGAVLAFQNNSNFIIINRGSQILANGTASEPITITSTSDLNGTVVPEDVQQWGGMVINGFGVSNKCAYVGTRGTAGFMLDPANPECHIEAEGSAGDDESQYGGDNDADDSGILRYVVVKHTGAEVANGSELNGISFGGVGSGTAIENLQVYSTYDDGIEMFGGSVSFNNYVAVYVRDDSIDIDEGWNGSITNALVIQQETNGQHCIESDGLGSYSSLAQTVRDDFVARGLNSRPTISNLTCIVTPNVGGTHGTGNGWIFREGIWPTINDSVVISSFGANDTTSLTDNYCLRIANPETVMQLNSVVFACQENQNSNEQAIAEGQGAQFATVASGTAKDPTAAADADLQLLEGTQPIGSLMWNVSLIDGVAPLASTAPTSGVATDILGAVSLTDDWTAGWTYGIHPDNRGQALWFE
ncbi:MAG: serine/threonine protein kinase [Proteobacteria bacterium]|nr:serine/threonine protein kinase [Pseudomonadota bacterium]MDA1063006.1 serine/threonine protein kinase [Pseudomonadota bacterium]